MKILTVGDVHLSDKTPISRLDDYTETVFRKLSQIAQIASERSVDLVLFTGDIFDKKAPTQNSHALVSRALTVFNSFPCDCYSIIGNHDVAYSKLELLYQQPLAVLFASGALKRLDEIEFENVVVTGIHYDQPIKFKETSKRRVAVLHVNSTPKGGNLFGEKLWGYNELATHPVDVFVLGHYHIDQGIQEHYGKHFVNLGSLTRGALNEDNISRSPKIGYIEIGDSIKTEEILIECEDSSKIFDLQKREETVEHNEKMEEFISKMQTNVITVDEDEIIKNLDSFNVEKEVRNTLEEYLSRYL